MERTKRPNIGYQPGLGLEKQQAVGVQQQQVSGKGAAGSELGAAKVDKQPSQILQGSSSAADAGGVQVENSDRGWCCGWDSEDSHCQDVQAVWSEGSLDV